MPMAAHHACFGRSLVGQMPEAFPSSLRRQRLIGFKSHISVNPDKCVYKVTLKQSQFKTGANKKKITDVPVHVPSLPGFAALSLLVNSFFNF